MPEEARMRAAVWIYVALSTASMFAGERMNVSVCTLGHLSESLVVGAEAEVAALFHSMDIEIVWAKCEDALVGEEAARQSWFTIRLRSDRPPGTQGPDTLGEAFFMNDEPGYLAEVYYNAAQALASSEQVEPAKVLGCVIAHELGHLLLGPGHAPAGIMRAAWDGKDLQAMRTGGLKFNRAESVRIRQVLQDSVSGSTAAF
jgi:hypothetical protein